MLKVKVIVRDPLNLGILEYIRAGIASLWTPVEVAKRFSAADDGAWESK